ncbi:hypothetical protein F0562_007042 [Nyssa sinensis]|uniref:Bulb-type lectin domain-containing protein n=1 Tax=Nyssa sinensis TaxID=561372 RepID=A0A5J5A4M0_9ASTE|nr:hypothetical protein F0562_007042 [Nyssa sinensis]
MKLIAFLIFAFLCIWGLDSSLVAGEDTIGIGEELNSSSNPLVSQGGNFTLGFFTLDNTNYSYFGIWYTNDDPARPVWVANPNTPILNNSGVLTIDGTGVLKMTNGGSTIVNIFDQVGSRNVSATLCDSVFGAFTLNWESQQLVIYRRGEVYWSSGLLRDQSFHFIPAWNAGSDMFHYNISYVSNNDERFIIFDAAHQNLPMWILTPNGQILDAANSRFIGPADFCYGYESDNGRANSLVPDCRGHNDRFEQRRGYFVGNSGSYDDNSSLSLSDCMERCWSDCTCLGFINNSNGTGCIIWSGNLVQREDNNPNSMIIYVLVRGNSSKGNRWWIWLIIAVAISLLMLLLCLFCYLRINRHRREGEEKKMATTVFT